MSLAILRGLGLLLRTGNFSNGVSFAENDLAAEVVAQVVNLRSFKFMLFLKSCLPQHLHIQLQYASIRLNDLNIVCFSKTC